MVVVISIFGKRPGMVMFSCVSDDEHGRIESASLNLFPRRTTFGTATAVVSSVSTNQSIVKKEKEEEDSE